MRNHLVAHPSFCFLVACSEVNVYPTMKYFINMDDSLMNFRKIWLRCWLTTPILMIRRMEVHQISEKEKYHTYWRLHLPILTTTIKRFFTYKYRYKQYIYHWPKCKKIQTYYSCILGTRPWKEHHPMHVMEKCTGDNVTSWNQFLFFPFFCQLSFIKSSILTYFDSTF